MGPLGYVFATLSPIPARCQKATTYQGNRSPLKGRWRALMNSEARVLDGLRAVEGPGRHVFDDGDFDDGLPRGPAGLADKYDCSAKPTMPTPHRLKRRRPGGRRRPVA